VVSDDGKGIEPTFLPFVFDRFKQADSSITRRVGGLGLGLALVRHIVELHGHASDPHASHGAGRSDPVTGAHRVRDGRRPGKSSRCGLHRSSRKAGGPRSADVCRGQARSCYCGKRLIRRSDIETRRGSAERPAAPWSGIDLASRIANRIMLRVTRPAGAILRLMATHRAGRLGC
jgi:hypothetical protein